jgi:ABC-type bacteriocin/lantibiotic exporter with double-glycine peptidase domain
MAKTTIKQYDITDCGTACLAFIASHFNLQVSVSVAVLTNNEVTQIFGGSYFLQRILHLAS